MNPHDRQLYWKVPHAHRRLVLAGFLFTFALWAQRVTVTLLATTDLHGQIYPYDYYTGKPANRGLAKIATLVREGSLTRF